MGGRPRRSSLLVSHLLSLFLRSDLGAATTTMPKGAATAAAAMRSIAGRRRPLSSTLSFASAPGASCFASPPVARFGNVDRSRLFHGGREKEGFWRSSECLSSDRLRPAFHGSANRSSSSSMRSSAEPTPDVDGGDTIYALSSGGGGYGGSGATAVAVIRLTGPKALDALTELLIKPSNTDDNGVTIPAATVRLPKPRMASLRNLYDPSTPERDPLDSALVLTFPGPRSFTGEDVVEIHAHGSRAVVRGVLDALSFLGPSLGLRPADPGEFTQRAYGSGKLGLVEVEALADLIAADTSLQRKQALRQFDGRLSRLYGGWREELIRGLAHAEAVIDFGDDESSSVDEDGGGEMDVWGGIVPKMDSLRKAMERHLSDASRGEILRDGLRVAIVGRPNAGKSSLLNALAGRDAAIVSAVPGTTRDVVEVSLDLGGVRCSVSDTAGVRDEDEGKEEGGRSVDEVELEGMRRAKTAAKDAHIIVGVVDATDMVRGTEAVKDLLRGVGPGDDDEEEDFDDEDEDGIDGNIIYVFNKLDLVDNGESSLGADLEGPSFGISCATGDGVDDFLSSLAELAVARVANANDDGGDATAATVEGAEGAVITRARHRRHVESAADALARFDDLSGRGYMALDLAAEELRLACSELGRITGAIDVEDVLDVLFADFCIGK